MSSQFTCRLCKRPYAYKKTKAYSKKYCQRCMTNRHRFSRKASAVEYKGGECQLCGYKKCLRALSFHHVDPSQKDFAFGPTFCRKAELLVAELDKCICVCLNCHQEVEEAIDWYPDSELLKRVQEIHESEEKDKVFKKLPWKWHHPLTKGEENFVQMPLFEEMAGGQTFRGN